tara:strand:+ start:187 stop:756 length:570 start_codon:yes stop_codon:yes gene_type:complete
MVKNNIRKSLLERGQLLSNKFISENNRLIQDIAINEIDMESSKNNLLYFPFRKEVCVDQIKLELKRSSKNIYMPRIISGRKMKFNLLTDADFIEKNKYGIKEIANENFLDPVFFNTMFIPFVGVDSSGFRLGYGGGYFDRALSNLNSYKSRPLIVGLGYDYQILSSSFGEPHDIKYDIVITESRIHSFS